MNFVIINKVRHSTKLLNLNLTIFFILLSVIYCKSQDTIIGYQSIPKLHITEQYEMPFICNNIVLETHFLKKITYSKKRVHYYDTLDNPVIIHEGNTSYFYPFNTSLVYKIQNSKKVKSKITVYQNNNIVAKGRKKFLLRHKKWLIDNKSHKYYYDLMDEETLSDDGRKILVYLFTSLNHEKENMTFNEVDSTNSYKNFLYRNKVVGDLAKKHTLSIAFVNTKNDIIQFFRFGLRWQRKKPNLKNYK